MLAKKVLARNCMVGTSTYSVEVIALSASRINGTIKLLRLTIFQQPLLPSQHPSSLKIECWWARTKSDRMEGRVRICGLSRRNYKKSKRETRSWRKRRRQNSKMTKILYKMEILSTPKLKCSRHFLGIKRLWRLQRSTLRIWLRKSERGPREKNTCAGLQTKLSRSSRVYLRPESPSYSSHIHLSLGSKGNYQANTLESFSTTRMTSNHTERLASRYPKRRTPITVWWTHSRWPVSATWLGQTGMLLGLVSSSKADLRI